MELFLQNDLTIGTQYPLLLAESKNFGDSSLTAAGLESPSDFVFPYDDQVDPLVIRDGIVRLSINHSSVGRVSITPTLILRKNLVPVNEGDPLFEDTTLITFQEISGTTNQTDAKFTWDGVLNKSHPLENANLILRLGIKDLRGTETPSVANVFNTSSLEAIIVEGEEQVVELFSRYNFKHFQKRERIFLYSTIEAQQQIDVPIYTTARSKETVDLLAYSRVNSMELIEEVFYPNPIISGPFTSASPHLTEVEIGDFILPPYQIPERGQLRKREKLSTLTEKLAVLPATITPPEVPVIDVSPDSYANAAEKMFEAFEMLKAEQDFTIPGNNIKIYIPGKENLGGGSDSVSTNESQDRWQLPNGYTYTKVQNGVTVIRNYRLDFPFTPTRVNPEDPTLNIEISVGNSIWFLLRHKPVGASLSTSLGGAPGNLVLKKKVTSSDEILVWMWDHVVGPFEISLFVNNELQQKPGFFGTSAAAMIA